MNKPKKIRKGARLITILRDEVPPVLIDEKTGKAYPVRRVPKGLRFDRPYQAQ